MNKEEIKQMSKLRYHKKPRLVPCNVEKDPFRISFKSPQGIVFEVNDQVRVMAKPIQKPAVSPQFTYGFARITNIKGNTIQIKLDEKNVVSSYIRYSVEIPPENSKKIRRISSIFGIS